MIPLQPADFQLDPSTLIILIMVGAMLQDDVTCTTVGLLSADSALPLPLAWAACFAGTLLGDLTWFTLARWIGMPLLRRKPLNWIVDSNRLEKSRELIARYGSVSIFAARFLPGVRTAIQVMIGSLHQRPGSAVVVFAFAALLYTLLVVGLCRLFRNSVSSLDFFSEHKQVTLLIACAAVLSAMWLIRRVAMRRLDSETEGPI